LDSQFLASLLDQFHVSGVYKAAARNRSR